jgi:hypothetical protein
MTAMPWTRGWVPACRSAVYDEAVALGAPSHRCRSTAPEDLECLPARVRGTGRCLRAARTHLLAMAWALTLAANPAPKPLSFTRTATPTLPAAAKGPVRGAPDIRDGPERPTVVMSANSADTQT